MIATVIYMNYEYICKLSLYLIRRSRFNANELFAFFRYTAHANFWWYARCQHPEPKFSGARWLTREQVTRVFKMQFRKQDCRSLGPQGLPCLPCPQYPTSCHQVVTKWSPSVYRVVTSLTTGKIINPKLSRGRIQNSFFNRFLQLFSPSFSKMQVNLILLRKLKWLHCHQNK